MKLRAAAVELVLSGAGRPPAAIDTPRRGFFAAIRGAERE